MSSSHIPLLKVLESMPLAVILADSAGHIAFVNEEAVVLFGYEASELMGKHVDVLMPFTWPMGKNPQFLARSQPINFMAQHKDGRNFAGSAQLKPIVANDNQWLIYTVQRVEEQLPQTEAWFQAVWDLSPDALVISDAEGIVLAANPAYCALYGYTLAEIVGNSFEKIFPLEQQQTALADYKQIFHSSEISTLFHSLIKTAEGTFRHVETRIAFILEAGQRLAMLSNIRDITEQKLAREGLHDSEVRYRTITELVTDYAYTCYIEPGGAMMIEWVTDSLTKLVGKMPQGEDIRPFWRQTIHDQDLPTLLEMGKHSLSGQVSERELRVKGQDGRVHWLRHYVLPVWDRTENRVMRLYVAIQDITIHKGLEMQLQQAQKMEAIGRLAGGIAHDFNNILTAILSYTDMLLRRFPDAESKAHQHTKQIGLAAERAANLTRQLLAFSRQQILEPTILNLNFVIEEMLELLHRLLGEDIELVTELSPEVGSVKADKGQLEQLLMNLAVNARDAMLTGGRFTIETTPIYLDKAISRQFLAVDAGAYIMLAVSDTGSGMDQETQARIFDPFFTTKEVNKGTGLGLAIVHGIVRQGGGHIWVDSQPGKGATFRIYLPSSSDTVGIIPEDLVQTPQSYGYETILLIEDEEMVRDIVRDTLKMQGYEVLEALGEAAVILCQEYPDEIHMVLTDVVMPGESGPILAQRIKQHRPDIKVLYMSGYTDDKMTQYGALAVDVTLLPKPFTPQILLQTVRSVLDSKTDK